MHPGLKQSHFIVCLCCKYWRQFQGPLLLAWFNFNPSMDIFEVKLTFDMFTVRGQQHLFWTHERMLLWKCQSFWDRKCLDLRGTRTVKLRIHAECSNHLSYQGQTFAVPRCWILALAYRYFWSKLTFDMLTVRGQQHSFSTHERMFLWKCRSFWDRKCLDLRGTRTPDLWAIRARHLLSHVVEYWLWRIDIFK